MCSQNDETNQLFTVRLKGKEKHMNSTSCGKNMTRLGPLVCPKMLLRLNVSDRLRHVNSFFGGRFLGWPWQTSEDNAEIGPPASPKLHHNAIFPRKSGFTKFQVCWAFSPIFRATLTEVSKSRGGWGSKLTPMKHHQTGPITRLTPIGDVNDVQFLLCVTSQHLNG